MTTPEAILAWFSAAGHHATPASPRRDDRGAAGVGARSATGTTELRATLLAREPARFVWLLAALAFFACAAGAGDGPQALPSGYVPCTDPRPELCTHEYRPVCAQRDTGIRCITTPCDSAEWVTRSNACTACSDPKVHGYRADACAES